MEIFGFELKRKKEENLPSFVEPNNDDGALVVAAGGIQSTFIDLDGNAKTEADLILRYRSMVQHSEVQQAIDDIVNEAVVITDDQEPISINTDDIPFSDSVKKKIQDEFKNVLQLLDFSNNGYEIFHKWYVDGRLRYHAIIDENNQKQGIQELRYIDPRKIRKVREYDPPKSGQAGAYLKTVKDEYYIFSETGFGTNLQNSNSLSNPTALQGLKIKKDSIISCDSGIMNEKNTVVVSHLHKAFKSLNQLKMLEDAVVIYRISRAPERRVFYIDVGNLPKAKAEQYLRDMMVKHKNKIIYDATTGEVKDDRRIMTMTDDFWLPRREGGRGTEITTLPAGQNLSDLDDVLYFQKKLYKSLNVPISRMESEGVFNIGRGSEITRDEIKFAKFVTRLRIKFSILFDSILEKQLVMKNIIKPDDWPNIKNALKYKYAVDNHFEELKQIDIRRERMSLLGDINNYKGEYFSKEWIYKNILQFSDEEIDEMKKQIDDELKTEPPIDPETGEPLAIAPAPDQDPSQQ